MWWSPSYQETRDLVQLSHQFAERSWRSHLTFLWNEVVALTKHFPNFNIYMNHLRILFKCRFWFSRSGAALRFCISDKYLGDSSIADLQTTLWVAGNQMTLCLFQFNWTWFDDTLFYRQSVKIFPSHRNEGRVMTRTAVVNKIRWCGHISRINPAVTFDSVTQWVREAEPSWNQGTNLSAEGVSREREEQCRRIPRNLVRGESAWWSGPCIAKEQKGPGHCEPTFRSLGVSLATFGGDTVT